MLNKFLEKIKLWGRTGKFYFLSFKEKFTASSKEEKVLYLVAISALGLLALFVLIFLYKCQNILLLFLLLWIFTKVEKLSNADDISQQTISVFTDETTIYSCSYEAVMETQDILNLAKPLSARSMMLYHAPLADGYPRFWIKAMKKNFSNAITLEEVETVLSEEIQRLFFLRRNEFFSEISGLYIDIVKERGSYFELAILPIIPETTDYINRKMQKEQMVYEDIKESGGVYDEQF